MVNVQTEHLENHTARLTVEVDAERIEGAMRQTARQIAKKGRVPGFRPGKAPYNVILNLYGREYVLSEALEKLGQEIYLEALKASEIEPYAPGALENIEDEGKKLTFIVPKAPTIDLGDYRAIRVEFETPEITDEMVDRAMEELHQSQALIEPVERAAQLGDQVQFSHIEIVALSPDAEDAVNDEDEDEVEVEEAAAAVDVDEDDVEDEADDEADDEDYDDDEDDEFEDDEDDDGTVVLHQHDYDRVLRDDDDDFFPGFSPEIVGLSSGDEKTFTLALPEDFDDEELAGRTLRCEVSMGQVSSRTVPEWSDALAKRISEEKLETMLELRIDVRKRLQDQAQAMANQEISRKALDELVEGATIGYPEELVDDYLDDLMEELDRTMRQRGFTLKDYTTIMGKTDEDVRADYRGAAISRAERSLVLRELVRAEGLVASEADIDAEIEEMAKLIGGEQSAQFKQFLNTENSRLNIQNQLVTGRAMDLLAAIAKGEEPPAAAAPVDTGAPVEAAAPAETEPPAVSAEPETPAEVADTSTE